MTLFKHPIYSRASLVKCVITSLGLAFGAHCQAQALQDNQWHGGISIGGSYASSNTSSQTFTVNANGSKATAEDKLGLYTLINYGSNKVNDVKTNTAQLFRLGGSLRLQLVRKQFLLRR